MRSCTFFWLAAVRITADMAKELSFSGSCERHIVPSVTQNTDKCARYSNTLLVSLNNRIYFREHKPPGHGDSIHIRVTDHQATPLSSLSLAESKPHPQSSKDVILPRFTLFPTREPRFELNDGDNTGTCLW
jgi:hypothetical protein